MGYASHGLLPYRILAVAAMAADHFAQMKEDIATKVVDTIPSIIDQSYEYTQEALDMETTIRTKMQALPAEELAGFEEDEIQLFVIGGILSASYFWYHEDLSTHAGGVLFSLRLMLKNTTEIPCQRPYQHGPKGHRSGFIRPRTRIKSPGSTLLAVLPDVRLNK